MLKKTTRGFLLMMTLLVGAAAPAAAGDAVSIHTGADLFNRYIWRGHDVASTPSIQPTLSVGVAGFELGAWGAYTLSNQTSGSDEIDFYLSYAHTFDNGVSITPIVTDYYYPNSGIRIFNFNNYDAVVRDTIPDPGAHLLEVGIAVSGPQAFPVTLKGYVNVYNDAGHNTYFELDYSVPVNGTDLTLLCGATGGSTRNPYYYGADNFQVINIGVMASRRLGLSEKLPLPFTVGFILDPRREVANLLVGVSF